MLGTVRGHVLDTSSKEGLPAATIRVLGGRDGEQSLATELDGTFVLTLPPGRYTLIFSTPEYIDQERSITVVASQTISLDLGLAPVAGETIELYGAIDNRRESAILAERRFSATVSDAISAQQISRSPDSNASDAAKRIVSATIQDNRYIVIRGLGGRYSTTLLNGVPLPSPDPDVPSAPLDLFPASLITNLTINKTFAPDMPGNFAGGALSIETRNYPTKFQFKAKVGLGANSQSSFREINRQDGGNLDMFGYDDGTRELPKAIPDNRIVENGTASQIAGFKNNWTIDRSTAGPNLSAGASLGDTVRVAGTRLGYIASANFGHSYGRRTAHIAQISAPDGNGDPVPSTLQLDDRQGIEQANLGAVGGLGWTPKPGHNIDLFTLYAHTGDAISSSITGTDANTSVIDRTRLQFLQRELLFTQLVGSDRLADQAILEWQGNVARVAQHEPDTRDLLRSWNDDMLAINSTPGSSERLFVELSDTTLGGALAVRMPLDVVKLKAGGSIQRSTRDYQARRFHFTLSGDSVYQNPDQAFSPQNAQMSMDESTVPEDSYTADRLVTAGYAMADYNLTKSLRLIGGVRVEYARLDVDQESRLMEMDPSDEEEEDDDKELTRRRGSEVLPSINAVYALTPSMNLRAAYAKTLARPNFREISPSVYFDWVRRRVLGGNENLLDTTIHNGDLRWEAFLGDSEIVAASVFAKHFVRPIERTVTNAGSGDNVNFANAESADSYGIELEARLSLARITPALAAFSVSGNLSLIQSTIDVDQNTSRAMQGQSPYVANLGLGYESAAIGTRVDLAYNSFGRRIEEVATAGAGNVYEEPFHRLDLTISQPLPSDLRLKLTASNLLDQRVVRTQDDIETFAYDVGVSVVGSLEYSLE